MTQERMEKTRNTEDEDDKEGRWVGEIRKNVFQSAGDRKKQQTSAADSYMLDGKGG